MKKIDSTSAALEKRIITNSERIEEIKVQQDKIIHLNHEIVMAELRGLSFQITSGLAAMSREINLDRRVQRIEEGMSEAENAKFQRTA